MLHLILAAIGRHGEIQLALPGCKSFERAPIDRNAEARAVGNAHDAAGVLDRARQHGLAKGVLGAVEFQERLLRRVARRVVRQHGEEL